MKTRIMKCQKCGKQTEWLLDNEFFVGRVLCRKFHCGVCKSEQFRSNNQEILPRAE